MKRNAWLALALVAAGLQAGCVTRRVMITSDPPGAVVFRNGQPIGATPVEEPFIYYGRYHYRFVKDGYEPQDVYSTLAPPWYEYPVIDFISENLIPYTFRDVEEVHATLVLLSPVRVDDVKAAGNILRIRGQAIQRPPEAGPLPSRQRSEQTAPPPLAPVPALPTSTIPAVPTVPPDNIQGVPPDNISGTPAPTAGFSVSRSPVAPSRPAP